ncbi:MAG: hypothetical protein HY074_17160 [Deltaproteobacteria bacterium]|nr:hypothetical protein [Deltaproteobacteria bacterium]
MKRNCLILSLMYGVFGITAYAQDIEITPCSNDPAAQFVEISGASATKIYEGIAKTLKVPVDQLGGTQANDMFCQPLSSTAGQPLAVRCSFLMKGNKNIPYPQVDPGFSGEKVITCDLPANRSSTTDQGLQGCLKNLKSANAVLGRLSRGVPVSDNEYKKIQSITSTISAILNTDPKAAPAK